MGEDESYWFAFAVIAAHQSVKPDHDAGDDGGGASCTLVNGIEAAVQGKGERLRGVGLGQ